MLLKDYPNVQHLKLYDPIRSYHLTGKAKAVEGFFELTTLLQEAWEEVMRKGKLMK